MVLPIYTYGQSVLREPAPPLDPDAPGFDREAFSALVDDMIDTMHEANGIGLAAPQIGKLLRVFVIDLSPYAEDIAEEHGGETPEWATRPLALINPVIGPVEEARSESFEEGCLSIPDLREEVVRPDMITLRFLNREFEPIEMIASGMLARVVQHELDHLDGVLFVDHISALRKRMIKRRLKRMASGDVEAEYPIQAPA
ncbi:peptide deformylase [Rubricoccus marinus]|uniref:Peptide deformylase n=1 Tax=Rubricoccus marinus TaxID=716817 RepID=A0A259TWV8_9BACT|nr:peptide deformylase [Rubricoccus marinus]OZC02245.1 peptide deformylase [Rubricoccus marinus]